MVLLCVSSAGASKTLADDQYRDEIESWRQKRLADLKAEDGWLSVTGLYWLRPGETRLGSDPASDLLLPDRLPGYFGTLSLADGTVEFRPAEGVAVTRNGKPFQGGQIFSDAEEHPDTLAALDVKLILLKRGERFAVRTKDNHSRLRTSFAGLQWYPVREDWRIQAAFIPHAVPHETEAGYDHRRDGNARQPGLRHVRARRQDLSPGRRRSKERHALVCIPRRH